MLALYITGAIVLLAVFVVALCKASIAAGKLHREPEDKEHPE